MDEERIERIKKMEEKLDNVQPKLNSFEESLNNIKNVIQDVKILSEYYSSKEWKEDFQADEDGKIPKDIKRGVLGEDTLYNLLDQFKEIGENMKKLSDEIKTVK